MRLARLHDHPRPSAPMLSASDDRYDRMRAKLGPWPGILTSSETAPNSPLWLNTNAATSEALRIGGCCICLRSSRAVLKGKRSPLGLQMLLRREDTTYWCGARNTCCPFENGDFPLYVERKLVLADLVGLQHHRCACREGLP